MTYLGLSLAVLAAVAALTAATLRRHRPGPLVATAIALVALTAVFDNVIVGAGIVAYDDQLIWGVRVGVAPIEDFAYAIAAVAIMPTLWTWLGRKKAADAS